MRGEGLRGRGWLAAGLVAATLLTANSAAEAYVYVGDGGRIARANNDGSSVDLDWLDAYGFACGVAVTPTHIYWAWLGGVGRANIDGSNPDPNFVVGAPDSTICGVTVSGGNLYWGDRGLDQIGRVGLDGAAPNLSFASATDPCAVAANATTVYWAPYGSGPIAAVERSTGAAVPVPSTGLAACSVAIDAGGIYYADRNAASATPIGFVQYNGIGLALGLTASTPCGIAVTSSEIIWANGVAGSVGRAPRNPDASFGPADQNFITGLDGQPCGVAVDDLPLPPPPPGGGSAAFSLGKVSRDRKKGTAKLSVSATGAGAFELSGKTLKTSRASLGAAGETVLTVKAKGKAKKALKKKGKAKVAYTVAFTPQSGSPSSEDGRLKLKRKK